MRTVSKWFALLIPLFPSFSFAESEICPKFLTHYENLQVSRETFGKKNEICYVSLHPMKVNNMKYRDFLLTSEGLLMVFNSFGEGDSSSTTGAREFYFFPRPMKDLQIQPQVQNKKVTVTFANQLNITFSTVSADIIELGKAKVTVHPDVIPENKGGVEITGHPGLLLDVGFSIGHSPSENQSGSSTFVDEKGTSCKVKNREIFSYHGDAEIKFTDSELKGFLSQRCPQLQIAF